MSHAATVVQRPLWTRTFQVLVLIALLGFLGILYRFFAGLGPATGLSDAYPWGLWIAFDVVTGTALGCGGYAVALLVYVLNKGKYHPLVRPALLTSALGYSIAGLAVAVDVGRPWLLWKVPVQVWNWNLNSAQLEVALCVMAYIVVLWIELAPAFLERWQDSGHETLAKVSRKSLPVFEKALPWIIAVGLLLPTMHQSSLGTMMLLTGPKLHPLWATPFLPLLFLIAALIIGYGVVVAESSLSAWFFGRRRETSMLAGLSTAMTVVMGLWLVLRFADLAWRGLVGATVTSGWLSFWFWLEIALVAVPMAMLLVKGRLRDSGWLFSAAALILVGGVVFRFNTYLMAYNPAPQATYFPTVPEIGVTVGLVALELIIFAWLVKTFPILSGTRPAPSEA